MLDFDRTQVFRGEKQKESKQTMRPEIRHTAIANKV